MVEAPPRSYYRKIHKILEYCQTHTGLGVADLASLINKDQPDEFTYFAKDKDTDTVIIMAVKPETIEEAIDFCINLGLINPDCSLTQTGKESLEGEDFTTILIQRIQNYLADTYISIEKISKIASDLLTEGTASNADNVYGRLGPAKRNKGIFVRCLSLLDLCGNIDSHKGKCYFLQR